MATPRLRIYLRAASGAYVSVVANIVVNIFSVPLALHYFGADRYGAIILTGSLTTLLSATQLGIPGAANVLSAKAPEGGERLRVICRSFFLGLALCFVALCALYLGTRNPRWVEILGKIPRAYESEIRAATYVMAVLFLVNLPFSILLSGFSVNENMHIEKIYATLSTIATFGCLLFVIWIRGGLVKYFALRGALTLAITVVGALHYIFYFENNRSLLSDNMSQILKSPESDEFGNAAILRTSFRIVIMGLAAMVVWGVGNFVISHQIGVAAVVKYAVTFRLVTIMFVAFAGLNVALSPMYGNAVSSGDYDWIQRAYDSIGILAPILGGLIWIGSISYAETIIDAWVGPSSYGGLLVVAALGGYAYCTSLVSTHANVMTSLNIIENGILISWSEALACLGCSYVFVHIWGIAGAALGMFVGAITTVFWVIPWEISRKTDGRVRFNSGPVVRHFLIVLAPAIAGVIVITTMVSSALFRLPLDAIIIVFYVAMSFRYLPSGLRSKIGNYTSFLPEGFLFPV